MPSNQQSKRFLEPCFAEKRFLSILESAVYISRHRSTLDKWRAENIVLPYLQDGKKIMYAVDDLDNYLASVLVEPIAYRCPEVSQSNGTNPTDCA